MKTLLLLLAVSACLAHAATIGPSSCGPTTVIQGGTVNCTAVLAGAGSQISACNATIVTSSATGPITVSVIGPALTAGKTSSASLNNWLVSGMNTNAIADGALVNFSFATLLTTPTGNFTISLTQLQCSTPTGTAVATTANPPQSISVSSVVSPNACDLNGDGLVNSADYDKARANLLASPQVPNIGTAIPTIMDVQIVANAANGASCTLGGGAAPITVTLASFTCAPSSFPAGGSSSCTARLSAAAPSAGAVIALSTPCSAVRLLASLTIPAGLLSAVTDANTSSGVPPQSCNVSGTYNGTTQTAVLMLQ